MVLFIPNYSICYVEGAFTTCANKIMSFWQRLVTAEGRRLARALYK